MIAKYGNIAEKSQYRKSYFLTNDCRPVLAKSANFGLQECRKNPSPGALRGSQSKFCATAQTVFFWPYIYVSQLRKSHICSQFLPQNLTWGAKGDCYKAEPDIFENNFRVRDLPTRLQPNT